MDARRRSQYLEAIGIDEWVPRNPVVLPEVAPAEGVSTALSAAVAESTMGSADVSAAVADTTMAPADVIGPANLITHTLTPPKPALGELSVELAAQWSALRAEVGTCTRCALHATRTQGVFGVGNEMADWLVIGEAPGAEEDRRGQPFVGRAGQLLDAMLKSIGLGRETNVYIANVLKSRPPGNRDPKPAEVAACLPYLLRQIALMRPRLILAVGRIAAQNLLSTDMPLGRLRGKVHQFGELNTPLIVTYHPAYLLRTPSDKRKAWEDLKFARSVFRQLTQGLGTLGDRT